MARIIYKAGFFFFFFGVTISANERKEKKGKFTAELQ